MSIIKFGTSTGFPYDTAFIAGFDSDLVAEDLAVATYGELIMARTGKFVGEEGFMSVAPTGADVTLDVLKNGVTIYSTKPKFNATEQTLTNGVISNGSFVAGDLITFVVTQVGSTLAGQGARLTLKGLV